MNADQPSNREAGNKGTPGLTRNVISLLGAILAAISLANIVLLFLMALVSKTASPYLGVLTYMVLPAFLILGLLLIPLGMWCERRRRRTVAPGEIPRLPRIDLNVAAQRSAFVFFVAFSVFFIMLSAEGSYRAYQFTESVRFCGQLCHTVMEPEYTAYLQSPHARTILQKSQSQKLSYSPRARQDRGRGGPRVDSVGQAGGVGTAVPAAGLAEGWAEPGRRQRPRSARATHIAS